MTTYTITEAHNQFSILIHEVEKKHQHTRNTPDLTHFHPLPLENWFS